MARFNDLPIEIQTDIWMLVLPARGGVHWVEFEGIPHPPNEVRKCLQRVFDQFGDKEPDDWKDFYGDEKTEYKEHCRAKYQNDDLSTPFFQFLYTIVPSVWGGSRELAPAPLGGEDVLTQEVLDEIAYTRRCRQLSTYTQISTLLLTCRSSRLAALYHVGKIPKDFWLWRAVGPMNRPRPLSSWKIQYADAAADLNEGHHLLVSAISPILDLVVFRLHTASGHPTATLRHSYFQLTPDGCVVPDSTISPFDRIGIEWHPLWATPEGRKEFSTVSVNTVIRLTGKHCRSTTQLYWLVDDIPRPQWDQYAPAIPAAFNQAMKAGVKRIKNYSNVGDPVRRARVLEARRENHDLNQEFEANGRRYYIVFVVAQWRDGYSVEETYLDPSVDWDGPFPGGEDIWPEALRDPVRLAYEVRDKLYTDIFCGHVMSWEPI